MKRRNSLALSLMFLCITAVSLTGCRQKEDITPTFSDVKETQSEDEFAISVDVEIEVNNDNEGQKSSQTFSADNSSSFNQNVSVSLAVPEGVELSEEEAVFLDSLVYSSLSDDEITEIIEAEENFNSIADKKTFIEDTLQYRNDLALSEEFEMETIDYSNDSEMLELIEKAEKQLEEDMQKEPIDLSQLK